MAAELERRETETEIEHLRAAVEDMRAGQDKWRARRKPAATALRVWRW